MDVRAKPRFLTFSSTSPLVCGYSSQLFLLAPYNTAAAEQCVVRIVLNIPRDSSMTLTIDVNRPKYGTPAFLDSSAKLVTYSKSTATTTTTVSTWLP